MNSKDLGFYLSRLTKRLPLIMATAVLIFAAAVVVALLLPKGYRASAKILAEAPQIPTELARSSIAVGAIEQLQILQQQILTRENLIALAERLDVYAGMEAKPPVEDLVKDMRKRISFTQLMLDLAGGNQNTVVFDVSFTAQDPVLAARVANELTSMLMARNQRQRKDRAGSTLQFFNQEVARLGAELGRREADILKFKTENKDSLPESLEFRRGQQSNLQERLVSLEREESDLRSRRSNLIVTYSNTGQLSDAVRLTPEQQMLADLNRALAEQLAIFSENSPNIHALRARISSLQNKLLGKQPVGKGAGADNGRTEAASFGLDLQLSDIDDRLEAIVRERESASKQVEELTKSISGTPASETVLNALQRNRENIQTQYNAAIARRAEALTGEQIEMRADGGRLTLIEPASPPVDPISSKRRPIAAAGALVGLALGVAIAGLLEFLDPTVRRPVDIVRLLEVQPLATIPIVGSTRQAKTVKRTLDFLAMRSSGAAVPAKT